MKKPTADDLFRLVGERDPFTRSDTSPYLNALLDLPPKERRIITRQVTLLCMAVPRLDPVEALQVLGQVGIWLAQWEQNQA